MNKICTDLEQSKKLLELGIDIYTADMYWKNGVSDKYIQCFTPFVSCGTNIDYDYDVPAWSLSALLGLMPTFTLNGFGNGQFNCRDKRVNNYALVDTCPLDAAFEMVCWLKENGKI